MKKRILEIVMACMLLACFYVLSREAAAVSAGMGEGNGVILVDAGHGGRDPGMTGADGLEEKGINLAIAKKLRAVLEERGYQVVMTRETDEGLYEEDAKNKKAQDLQNRIALIRKTEPLLSVSIHQNSYSDASVRGPQVFYFEHSAEGKKLAFCIQEAMNRELADGAGREAKGNTGYYLLKRSSGILNIVECGFLTNPEEAALLQTEEYQRKLSLCIADGIEAYLKNGRNEMPETLGKYADFV